MGLSDTEILSMDVNAAQRYWKRYDFFHLYEDYRAEWDWEAHFAEKRPTTVELFLKAIFSDQDNIYSDYKKRYDSADIKRRLNETLKTINSILPGTIHENAEITNLRIRTETFISFPQCGEMIRSFLDMVERLKELFFKAIHTDLNEREINELNFLASWLNACDVTMPSTNITYDNLLLYREVYAEENLSDFFDYVRIRSFIYSSPWRCKEFFEDLGLIQEFINVFPEAKGEIRKFSQEVGKFTCEFVWSDAKPIMFSEEEGQELSDNAMIGEEDISINERTKERTIVYVNKTPEEMDGCEEYIQRIAEVTAASAKGGLNIPFRKSRFLDADNISRIKKRISARPKGGKS